MSKYFVKNVGSTMNVYNLVSRDQSGKRMSLILAKGEVSRGLNYSELNSVEVQKALAAKELVNVSARVNG